MELNTYFERMNTSGKSLENYEILKVDIIRRLRTDKEKYTLLWNACSIMEKMILRKHNNEQLDSLRNRYKNAMSEIIQNGNIDNAFEKYQTKFDIEEEEDSDDNQDLEATSIAIGDIAINTENPYKIIKRRTDEHSLLTFPEFLLQVLYLYSAKTEYLPLGWELQLMADLRFWGLFFQESAARFLQAILHCIK